MIDSWRLALGTLTAVPVRPPARVDRTVARGAMLLAPVAALPLALMVAAICWAGSEIDIAPLGTAVVAVAALSAGSRALHWDGLADTADGLTASYDRERSLAVMRSGTSGPAGVVAIVVVLLAQVAGLSALVGSDRGWLTAGVLVCVSRGALPLLCVRGLSAARSDGLGAVFVATVPWTAAVGVALGSAAACWWVAGLSGLVGVMAAGVVLTSVARRASRRLGGVTGDVFGAGVELTLACLLLSVS